jgi:acetoacetate decarboxylase
MICKKFLDKFRPLEDNSPTFCVLVLLMMIDVVILLVWWGGIALLLYSKGMDYKEESFIIVVLV